jgi:selenide, water dikinase
LQRRLVRACAALAAGAHSIDGPDPKYGMAVTGTANPAMLLRIDNGQSGQPLSLTKPIGTGVLNLAQGNRQEEYLHGQERHEAYETGKVKDKSE